MNHEYQGPERRKRFISEVEIEELADKAAEKASDKTIEKLPHLLYMEVGRSVVNRLFYIIGVISVAAYLWLKAKGIV